VKLIILSLKTFNDRSILNYDLTNLLTSYFDHHSDILEINLPTGTIRLNKFQYLNKAKIYEDPKNPKCFFMVFSYKKPNEDWAFNELMKHAINQLDKKVDNIIKIKNRLQSELVA
jgi:hypothetical protein